ncbi:hypothetical protein Shal_3472 [Shewanella halifaxensis HAW-EB4]|uniref:AdoMet activation domain-containing protein n=1 Tax=Shewanella halifaxensis (strain HAW-EB4) TaxID=458817 RepID=B0TT76_SHEHH|nr:hypothetical protein [Shewanella halifaxensis]ABZ78017.1 hypothetical protein Shal_3472 [Shewanella halifaxensis HAW-EB4]
MSDISRDQVEDYAERKRMSIKEIERCLAPMHDYAHNYEHGYEHGYDPE